jgi:dTDP-4-amino-4,6-dideoxygalactose transaminase
MSSVAVPGFKEEHRPYPHLAGKPTALEEDSPATIPVCRPKLPTFDQLEPYLRRIDANRLYTNYGPLVLELEGRLSCHFNVPRGGLVCAGTGTAALFGAIIAVAGRAQTSRPWAIVPGLTFAATAAAVEQAGYLPYIVDVDPATWMMNPEIIADHPMLNRVGLVVPVAPFGRPVPMEPWLAFREKCRVPVVIDGAASFQNIAEAPRTFLGDIPVCISLHATKSFSTGEGGCVATTNVEQAERAAQALNFGFRNSRDSASPSTNGKMSEYHAAVGLAEFDAWPEKRVQFCRAAESYRHILADSGLADRYTAAPDIGLNYALFSCKRHEEVAAVHKCLSRRGVDFRHWYGAGLHSQSHYSVCPRDRLDVTEQLATELLGIPMAPDLSLPNVTLVADSLLEGVTACLEREIDCR